ncbi:MAG: hypothetical protein ACRCVX_10715 [Shewanella sp.]
MNLNWEEMTDQEKKDFADQYQRDAIAEGSSPKNPDDEYMNEDLG